MGYPKNCHDIGAAVPAGRDLVGISCGDSDPVFIVRFYFVIG